MFVSEVLLPPGEGRCCLTEVEEECESCIFEEEVPNGEVNIDVPEEVEDDVKGKVQLDALTCDL